MNLFKKAAAVAMSALVVAAGMPMSANAAAQKITQFDISKAPAAISGDGVYRVIGSGSNDIVVASDTTATITLANAGGSEIKLGSNANVTILLTGNNKFTGVYEPTSSHITITEAENDGGWGGGFGNHAYIKTGSATAIYGHMSRCVVHTGEKVSAGQVIGYVGSTGNSTGAHLHFQVVVDGTWNDYGDARNNPWNYVRKN